MARDLPSLDWLRVFAACAATESFAVAAGQLGVTAGAVSQRIKSLEGFLGFRLFERHSQGVRLTEYGKRYALLTAGPLDQLAAATRDLMGSGKTSPVRITILPALAQLWLGPRIDEFHRKHENTHVEIWADPAIVDLRTSSFDLAIRYGRPPFPGCDYRPLLFDEVVPVASPQLVESGGLDASGLPSGATLNIDAFWENDFEDWRAQTGTPCPPNLTLQTFSLYSMAIEATLNGRGFLMGHTSLVSDLVDQGKLVCLSEDRMTKPNQFYLLTKSGVPLTGAAQSFVDWISTLG